MLHYGVPDDLLTIDLGDLRPDLKGQRLRGRIEGKRVVPYYSRAELEAGGGALKGRALLYVDDPIDLFFLMIQGSGRVRLDSGRTVRVNYADQNGHPYRSIGRLLIDRGDLKAEQASMQGIKGWARANPAKLKRAPERQPELRVLPRDRQRGRQRPARPARCPGRADHGGTICSSRYQLRAPGCAGVARDHLAEQRAAAGAPDARAGHGRSDSRRQPADFFWGFGDEAGREAGRMRQSGEMWLLWPNGAGEPPP